MPRREGPPIFTPPKTALSLDYCTAPAHDANMETEPGSEDECSEIGQNPENLWEGQETFCMLEV